MTLVSVFLITYNHDKFIAQCLDSMLSQKVNFKFEIVIGEDISTDDTRSVCEQYARQYPDIIKLLPSDKKYGAMLNAARVYDACTGKYVALCEGDDYWIDDLKLQKQVDFLEANPDFSMCFTAIEIKDELNWNWPYERYIALPPSDVVTMEDIVRTPMNMMPTPTLMIRNDLPKPFPEFYMKGKAGDIGLQLFLAEKGKAKYFPDKTAVYRNHGGGMTKIKDPERMGDRLLKQLYKDFDQYSEYRHTSFIRKRLLAHSKEDLIFGANGKKGLKRLKHYLDNMPDYLKYSDRVDWKELVYYHVVLFFPFALKLFKKKK